VFAAIRMQLIMIKIVIIVILYSRLFIFLFILMFVFVVVLIYYCLFCSISSVLFYPCDATSFGFVSELAQTGKHSKRYLFILMFGATPYF
jgi:hypothetical protein